MSHLRAIVTLSPPPMTRALPALAMAAVLAACGRTPPPASVSAAPPVATATPSPVVVVREDGGAPDWRRIATDADRERLRAWRDAWVAATTRARAAGSGAALDQQGALFRFDEALDRPLPPPGNYRCRTFKLGAKGAGMPDYTAYPWFACRIAAEGDVTSLTKLTGSQRQVGLLFAAAPRRGVFLGTLMLGGEARPMEYGRDAGRDVAGWVERVDTARWRVAMPWPAFESTLDVLELVPAA